MANYISLDRIKTEMQRHVGNRTHGYFITLDTPYTTLNRKIDRDFIERTETKLIVPFVDAMNSYCYGRSFRRHQKQRQLAYRHGDDQLPIHGADKRLCIVEAMEIGKETLRLHSHLIMLHDSDCDRSIHEIEQRARLIWNHLVKRCGESLVHISQFDPNRHWLNYMTKSFTFIQTEYKIENVRFH